MSGRQQSGGGNAGIVLGCSRCHSKGNSRCRCCVLRRGGEVGVDGREDLSSELLLGSGGLVHEILTKG